VFEKPLRRQRATAFCVYVVALRRLSRLSYGAAAVFSLKLSRIGGLLA
jgi:hypothetical protein